MSVCFRQWTLLSGEGGGERERRSVEGGSEGIGGGRAEQMDKCRERWRYVDNQLAHAHVCVGGRERKEVIKGEERSRRKGRKEEGEEGMNR